MSEIEKDYVAAKQSMRGCGTTLQLWIAIFVFIFVGIPCAVWFLGAYLYFWWLTVPFTIFALWILFQRPKGYKR